LNSLNKSIILTGSSGFLGAYIKSELEKQDFNIITLGRKDCDIDFDLSKGIPNIPKGIDFVIHAAGKAHSLPKTEKEKALFFQTNYNGTLNLLDGIKHSGSEIKSIIFISSVSVYGINEGENIDESYPLLATDPYGKSKIMAEAAITQYCKTDSINNSILRLPLIAGKNPPGNLGAMIRALKKGMYLSIGNAEAKKSMVLAEDVASLIPELFNKSGIYNLTDGYHPSFKELETSISFHLNKRNPLKINQSLANLMAKTGNLLGKKSPFNTKKLKKIQSTLTFSDEKARKELGWKPHSVIDYYNQLKG